MPKCGVDLSKVCVIISKGRVVMSKCGVDLIKHCLIMPKGSVVMSKCGVDLSKHCLIMSKSSVIMFKSGVDLSKPFPKQALVFTCLQYKSFENNVGKRDIALNEQFLLYPHCFLPIWIT